MLKGEILFAYANGEVVNDFLKSYYRIHKRIIPNPDEVKIFSKRKIPKNYRNLKK